MASVISFERAFAIPGKIFYKFESSKLDFTYLAKKSSQRRCILPSIARDLTVDMPVIDSTR
jgi:hypothetical protein